MVSRKHLSAVSHDIAHHAVSGISWLHPHLGEACRRAKKDEVVLEVSRANPLPDDFPATEPLKLASRELHRTFRTILEKKGFAASDVKIAELRFVFSAQKTDDYCATCFSRLLTSDDREFSHRLQT